MHTVVSNFNFDAFTKPFTIFRALSVLTVHTFKCVELCNVLESLCIHKMKGKKINHTFSGSLFNAFSLSLSFSLSHSFTLFSRCVCVCVCSFFSSTYIFAMHLALGFFASSLLAFIQSTSLYSGCVFRCPLSVYVPDSVCVSFQQVYC